MCETQGAVNVLPWSATLFLAGFLAITGSPPFAPFLSEFTILRGIFSTGHVALGLAFIGLLAVIFIGMSNTVIAVALGPFVEEQISSDAIGESFLTVFSPLLLMAAVLVLGFYLPEPLRTLFHDAANLLEVAG
jgi:hydrogenase-4 component F